MRHWCSILFLGSISIWWVSIPHFWYRVSNCSIFWSTIDFWANYDNIENSRFHLDQLYWKWTSTSWWYFLGGNATPSPRFLPPGHVKMSHNALLWNSHGVFSQNLIVPALTECTREFRNTALWNTLFVCISCLTNLFVDAEPKFDCNHFHLYSISFQASLLKQNAKFYF